MSMFTSNPLNDEQQDELHLAQLTAKMANINHLMSYQIDEFHGIPVFLSDNVVLNEHFVFSCYAFIGRHHATKELMMTVNTAFTQAPSHIQQALLMFNYAQFVLGYIDNPIYPSDDIEKAKQELLAFLHTVDDWVVSQGVDWAEALEYLSKQPNFSDIRHLYTSRALRLKNMNTP